MKVYEVIGETLKRARVGRVFGVMGDGNMRWLAELTKRTGSPVGFARNEAAAVAMADGHARATGSLGVCTVTAGPGLALTALPLITAARHGTPLLLIAGDSPVGDTVNIQYMDQRRFVHGLGLEVHDLLRPDFAAEDVRFAIETTIARSEPLVLNTPMDVQEADHPWDLDEVTTGGAPAKQALRPTSADLQQAAETLVEAKHPVVIAGRGAMEDGARGAIERLAQTIGASLATTILAKGLFEGDPRNVGIAGLFASAEGHNAFAEADCVLVVGASLNSYTTEGGTLFPFARIVQIDKRPWAPKRNGPKVDCYLQGTARATIEDLLALIEQRRPSAPTVSRRASLAPSRSLQELTNGRLDPTYLMRSADAYISADAMVVIGIGHFWWFAVNELRAADRRFIFSHDFGAIGQALPMAIGASAAVNPVRTVVVEGDASIMMCIQEIDTAVRGSLPLTILVLNDETLGAEFHKLRSKGMDPTTAIIPTPDLAAVARALGAKAAVARTPGEVEAALKEVGRSEGPYLIDFRISRDVVSDPYRKLYFPTGDRAP